MCRSILSSGQLITLEEKGSNLRINYLLFLIKTMVNNHRYLITMNLINKATKQNCYRQKTDQLKNPKA